MFSISPPSSSIGSTATTTPVETVELTEEEQQSVRAAILSSEYCNSLNYSCVCMYMYNSEHSTTSWSNVRTTVKTIFNSHTTQEACIY